MSRTRAQVTAFIIIGLLLLLGVGISVFMLGRQVTRIEPRVDVPADIRPVFDYVQSCLHQVGRDGIVRLGAQAGFLNIPPIIARTPTAHIPLDPAGVFQVPLWYHDGEMRIPALPEMERELALDVRDGLRDCADLTAFPEYTIEATGPIVPTVELGDESVIITVKWPLNIKKGDKTTAHDTFIDSLDAPVKRMWELGKVLLEEENRVAFFENVTLGLLTANLQVPFSGMEFSCGVKRWYIPDVKSAVQETLANNLPFVRVEGVANPPYADSLRAYEQLRKDREVMLRELEQDKETLTRPKHTPEDAYEFFRMTFRPGVSARDLRVGFDYQPAWGIRMNVQPNDGSILKSNLGKGARKYLPFFCINQWHFAYDLIYPLRTSIYAPEALDGEGYRFQFGFPVVIEDNEQARRVFGYRRFLSTEAPVEYCEAPGDTLVDVRALGVEEGAFAAEELKDVNLTFRCLAIECPLGQTISDEGHYRLRTALPDGCTGGQIVAEKGGYLRTLAEVPVQGGVMEFLVPRLPPLTYTVVRHPYFEVDQRLDAAGQPLGTNQQAIVQVTYRNGSYDQMLQFPQNQTAFAAFPELTGHYEISIRLFDAFGNIIGGYEAENLKIAANEVAGASAVTFHVVEYRPLPTTPEGRVKMLTYVSEGSYVEQLRPTFE
jgi:hypothetical protein